MTEDYARRVTHSKQPKPKRIKLLVFVAIALVLAGIFWLLETWEHELVAQSTLPPVSDAQAVGQKGSNSSHDVKQAQVVSSSSPAASQPADGGIEFEFYSILPEIDVEAAPSEELPAAQEQGKSSLPAVMPKSESNQPRYWLQLGAYYTSDSAETFQSRLELLGLDTIVDKTPASSAEGKDIYRVEVGPYSSYDGAKSKQVELKEMHLDSLVKKEKN